MSVIEYFEKLDTIDCILILIVIILIYLALSNNYEYYSNSSINAMPDDNTLIKTIEKPINSVGKTVDDEISNLKQKFHKGDDSGDLAEYNNPFYYEASPVEIENQPLVSSKQINTSDVVGIMDKSNYMGINVSDMSKSLAPNDGINVLNSSLGDLTQIAPQNLANSSNMLQYNMSTKSLLEHDQQNGFNPHDSSNTLANLDSIGDDLKKGVDNIVDRGQVKEGFTSQESLPDNRYHCVLIHADWCGFCQKAKPHWDRIVSEHHGQNNINNTHGYFESFEESKDSHLIGKGKKYEVDGFPTFIFTKIQDGVEQSPIKFNAITYETILDEIKKLL